MDFLDYREKLGVGFCDEDKAGFLITNLISYAKVKFSSVGVEKFVYYLLDTGSPIRQNELVIGHEMMDEERGNAITNILLAHQDVLEDFLSYFIPLINRSDKKERIEHKRFLETMFRTAHIPYEILEENDRYFIFPKGAEELDNALVSQPLEWLIAYPKSHTAFVKALKRYSEATADSASEVADLFRKALETFFQEFFGGGRSFEKYVSDHTYEQYLDARGVPSDMRTEFKNTAESYYKLINNNAKHHDKTRLNILEYLMYQTGNIIRLLITLKQEEQTDAD